MRIPARLAIVLIAAVAVFAGEYYLIQASGVGIGSWKYCLIVGFGPAIVLFVWGVTSPKRFRGTKISN